MRHQIRCRPQFAKWHKLLQEADSFGAFEILSLVTSCLWTGRHTAGVHDGLLSGAPVQRREEAVHGDLQSAHCRQPLPGEAAVRGSGRDC